MSTVETTSTDLTSASARGPRRILGLDAEQRRLQRREQLLEAALDLFAANGYVNTSIEQICQAAYVGTKGFYELFDSKEACYRELLVSISLRAKTAMEEAWESAPDNEEAATEHVVRALAHAITDDSRVALVTFGYASGISPGLESVRRANRRYAAQYVVDRLWERFATPSPGDQTDRMRMALGLIGGLFELLADWIVDADPNEPAGKDRLISEMTAFASVVRNGLATVGSR